MTNPFACHIDEAYMIQLRRSLHQYPEVAFDLPRTLALVRTELDKAGIPYTDKYGKSSLVASINDQMRDQGSLALRADMDALDLKENSTTSYRSMIEGHMHACGHDAHTAILLGVIRALSKNRHAVPCRVVFIFQAAEEAGGATHMAGDGIAGEFDRIAGCHVFNELEAGSIAIHRGTAFAACRTFSLTFSGKAVHAATPEKGIDAIRMGVEAYNQIEQLTQPNSLDCDPFILRVCTIEGGQQTNLIAERCTLKGTIRAGSDTTMYWLSQHLDHLSAAVAAKAQGIYALNLSGVCPAVVNDNHLVDSLYTAAQKTGAQVQIRHQPLMLSEDFSILKGNKPGVFFLLGTGNQKQGLTAPLHSASFDIDERALLTGARTLIQFICDQSGS